MIYHSIRVKWKAGTPQDKIDEALDHLRRMGREISAIVNFCVGRDVGGDFDHGAMFAVEDIEGYREYMHAPVHREIDDLGLPHVQDMISQDLTDDADPAIGEKIREVHQRRFDGDPELLALVKDLGTYSGSGVPA